MSSAPIVPAPITASPTDSSVCDPTFEICDTAIIVPAAGDDSTSPSNDTAIESTNGTNTTTASSNSTSPSASTLPWGILSTLQLVGGYMIYNQYDSLATSLYAGKSAYQTTNWGSASWVKTQQPIQNWMYTSYAIMGMQSLSVTAWLLQMGLGMDKLFLKMYTVALLFPVIQIGLSVYTYLSYSACSGSGSGHWTGDTSGTTSQVVSCSSYTTVDWVPTVVTNDNYQVLTGTSSGGALLLLLSSIMMKGKYQDAFGSKAIDASGAADADSDANADSDADVLPADADVLPAGTESNSTEESEPTGAEIDNDGSAPVESGNDQSAPVESGNDQGAPVDSGSFDSAPTTAPETQPTEAQENEIIEETDPTEAQVDEQEQQEDPASDPWNTDSSPQGGWW